MCLKIAIYIHCNLVKSSIIVTISVMYLYIKIKKLHPGSCCIAIYQKKRFTWSLVLHLNYFVIQYIQQYYISQFADKQSTLSAQNNGNLNLIIRSYKTVLLIVSSLRWFIIIQLIPVYQYRGYNKDLDFFQRQQFNYAKNQGNYIQKILQTFGLLAGTMCRDNWVDITPMFREQLNVTYVANVMVL
eukprot:TRINITY_DN1157_c0_g1_i8.p1 TRINITY_DN1157_c0_g1~~TRINITY_DN1157_c0_g1_i8.p1  ORF type:complete len:186 (-),score=-18.62 TRINITY_DN1157_c0_g1_i8:78-635(-)